MDDDEMLQEAIRLSMLDAQPGEGTSEPAAEASQDAVEDEQSRKRRLEGTEEDQVNPRRTRASPSVEAGVGGPQETQEQAMEVSSSQQRSQDAIDIDEQLLQQAIALSLHSMGGAVPADFAQQAVPDPGQGSASTSAATLASNLAGPVPPSALGNSNPFAALFGSEAQQPAAAQPEQQTSGTDKRGEPEGGKKMRPSLPQWLQTLEKWSDLDPEPSNPIVVDMLVPEEREAELATLLTTVLDKPVVFRGTKPLAGKAPGSISVVLVSAPGGEPSYVLSRKALTLALRTRAQAQHLQRQTALQILADCHKRAKDLQAKGGLGDLMPIILRSCQILSSEIALKMIGDHDREDLYFEYGQEAHNFLDGLESGHIGLEFLEAMLEDGYTDTFSLSWRNLEQQIFQRVQACQPFTDPQALYSKLRMLDILFKPAKMQRLLMHSLVLRLMAACHMLDDDTEPDENGAMPYETRSWRDSFYVPLISLSPIPDPEAALQDEGVSSPAREAFTSLRCYPQRRGEVITAQTSIRQVLRQAHLAIHDIIGRLVRSKSVEPKNGGRELVLGWLAMTLSQSAARASQGEGRGVINQDFLDEDICPPDSFALGIMALCLRFCRPFLPPMCEDLQKHLGKLSTTYYDTSGLFRLPGVNQGPTLAGRDESQPKDPQLPLWMAPDRDPKDAPHFIAECFFLTQHALHTCLLPAVNRFSQIAIHLQQTKQQGDQDSQPSLEYFLFEDCTLAQLLDPEFAGDVVNFCMLQLAWLNGMMKQPEEAARRDFARVPEFVLRDLAAWLSFVVRMGEALLLASLPMGLLMDTITGLLQAPHLVRSAVVQFRLVELLQGMLAPQLQNRRRQQGGVLGPTYLRPGEAALVAAVLGTGAAQEQLVPALMKAYAAADHVVGLDVDRDQFDKFTFRSIIASLLQELWKDPGCAASLTRVAKDAAGTGEAEVFSDYVGAVLNSLIYLLEDSIQRLHDIHNIETSKADTKAWDLLNAGEKMRKEAFYKGQQRTTQGFMRMARQALKMLDQLSSDAVIKLAFLEQPLVKRAAYASVAFINQLAGPRCKNLEVERPEQYGFQPEQLLLDMVQLVVRLAESPVFVEEVAGDADFDEGTMREAHRVLVEKQLGSYEHTARLEKLIQQAVGFRQTSAGTASASNTLMPEFDELTDLEAVYIASLKEEQIGDFDSAAPHAYNREYAKLAAQAAGNVSQKMKRLTREMRDLRSGKTDLALGVSAAIFVRHDSDRMDKLRAMMTGPEGTPYAGGCFTFDVFFPQDYPNVPPLMVLETTGLGRARLNPNLYADGKVCLSLLGTWHGTDASEKWNPVSSTLYQVLMSIMAMIFIPDPYFNEPNVENMRGTAEGKAADSSYNATVVLNTIRYAMIDQIKAPRPGFEEVTLTHFRLLRRRIMAQCRRWMEDAAGMDKLHRTSLENAVAELHSLLAEL